MSATLETDWYELTDIHKAQNEFIVCCLPCNEYVCIMSYRLSLNNTSLPPKLFVGNSLVINNTLKVEKAKVDFQHLVNKYISSSYYVPGIGDTAVTHTNSSPIMVLKTCNNTSQVPRHLLTNYYIWQLALISLCTGFFFIWSLGRCQAKGINFHPFLLFPLPSLKSLEPY